ncbi:MAG: holo-ACP synthase [Rickettsiales bacterium]|nr:MAG: holo-ACP synthase [Rickettsiales bacterium]
MIIGIGTDLLVISRLEKVYNKFGNRFVEKILSDKECEIFAKVVKKVEYLAKKFSVKEAITKSVGLGIGRGINMNDISILSNELGQPFVKFNDKVDAFLLERYKAEIKIHISITDEGGMVNAVAVAEK